MVKPPVPSATACRWRKPDSNLPCTHPLSGSESRQFRDHSEQSSCACTSNNYFIFNVLGDYQFSRYDPCRREVGAQCWNQAAHLSLRYESVSDSNDVRWPLNLNVSTPVEISAYFRSKIPSCHCRTLRLGVSFFWRL